MLTGESTAMTEKITIRIYTVAYVSISHLWSAVYTTVTQPLAHLCPVCMYSLLRLTFTTEWHENHIEISLNCMQNVRAPSTAGYLIGPELYGPHDYAHCHAAG